MDILSASGAGDGAGEAVVEVLAVASLQGVVYFFRYQFISAVLIMLGAVLLARLAGWIGRRVTDRIDAKAKAGDALVRSESAKHSHSVTQVLTWVTVVLIYTVATFLVFSTLGVPLTSLVAPATVLGVGLGFGAQRIVQDVLAGFFIITERQYGYGDVVSIMVTGGGDPATGTIEDVTLRITRLRNADGEVVILPNGQIVKVTNLSRDWARAVIDVPVPADADVTHVQEVLRQVGADAYADERLHDLLLDEPTLMGVESLSLDEVALRIVARTLPGKQFEVGRDLRARVALALAREGIRVPATASTSGPSGEPSPTDRSDGGGDS